MDGLIRVFPATLVMILLSTLLANSGGTTGPCPEIDRCLSNMVFKEGDQCSWFMNLLRCIAGLGDTCQLKEDHITFQKVTSLSQQFCEEIFTDIRNSSECPSLSQCVLGSKPLGQLLGNTTNLQDRAAFMLDSQIWCLYLEAVAGCYGSSTSNCEIHPELLSFMTRQRSELKTVCYSSPNGGRAGLGSSILVLLLAVLTAGAHSFL